MTEYIKIPTVPTMDLLRGVEAISPYPRVDPKKPREEGYTRHQPEEQPDDDQQARRRFLALRQLIDKLEESAPITHIDFSTAGTELHTLGLAIVEKQLVDLLLKVKIPLDSIDRLSLLLDQRASSVTLGEGRLITSDQPTLFPVSARGLSEYNLKIEDLQIHTGEQSQQVREQIETAGHCIIEQNRLRLTFSQPGPEAGKDLLKLKISVLLGVVETDDAGRRAILYPRGDSNYGLYADKQINMTI